MAKSFQDSLARKLYRFQNKIQSFNVKIKGTEVSTIMLEIVEDRYHNTQMSIVNRMNVTCVISFPMDEIPVSLSSTQNSMSNESSNVLHLWELLPITCFFRNDEIENLNIRKGNIILYKLKTADGKFQVMELQITDCIAKGNPSSGILYSEYSLAPVTDFALRDNEEYRNIIDEYAKSDVW